MITASTAPGPDLHQAPLRLPWTVLATPAALGPAPLPSELSIIYWNLPQFLRNQRQVDLLASAGTIKLCSEEVDLPNLRDSEQTL